MEVQLTMNDEPNSIILACPQGLPNYKEAHLLTKGGENVAEPETRKMIKLSNDQMIWVGRQEQINSNIYIGVQQGNKIQVHPIIMQATLQQQINKQNKQHLSRNSALEDGLTYFEQRKMVAEEMGTNKSRRKMRQMETNKVDEENIVQAESIKEKFASKQTEIKEQLDIEKEIHQMEEAANKEEMIPEYVKGHVPIDQIYNIRSIISEEDMELLDISKLQVYLSTRKEEVLHFYHPQVISIIQNLQFDNKSKLKILKYLEYLNLMFKFLYKSSFHNKSAASIAYELHINTEKLVTPILNKFYQATPGQGENTYNFNRSNFQKDKFYCYLIVLHLFIHKFQFDIVPLAKHLKMEIKKLTLYCKECGCTVSKNNDQQFAKLKPFKQQ